MDAPTQGASFTLGGVYFGDTDHGLIVTGRDDPGWPGLKRTVHDVPGKAGVEMEGGYLDTAKWSVPCEIYGDDESAVRTRLENLLYLLNSDQEQQLIFDSRPDVYWMVSAVDSSAATWRAGQGSLALDISFSLADPTAHAVTATTQVETVAATPHAFTVPMGSGAVSPHSIWVIAPTAIVATLSLVNATTGETFSTSIGIAIGNYLKLDSLLQEVFTSPDGVTWARNNSGASGTIPRLSPRVDNAVTLTGVSAGSLTLTFNERYAGIVR